jgi:hypothetical protein
LLRVISSRLILVSLLNCAMPCDTGKHTVLVYGIAFWSRVVCSLG